MSKSITRAVTYFGAAIVMMTAAAARAQEHTCAFVNDNYFDAPNTVDGYICLLYTSRCV